jgi:hypothetical protein
VSKAEFQYPGKQFEKEKKKKIQKTLLDSDLPCGCRTDTDSDHTQASPLPARPGWRRR